MDPNVFEPKKSGEICKYVDFRELNKKTAKNSYLLPLPDEVQDWLSGWSTVISLLDLQSSDWQMPVNEDGHEKATFFLGPCMGLLE